MLKREEFKINVDPIINWIQSYFENIESFPVKSQVNPGEVLNALPDSPPQSPESIPEIMKDLDDIILPGITHWQHPNYHAYFPANASIESLYAEMITSAIAAQCMIWETSPSAAELEQRMMEWLRSMLGLPNDMEGVIQDTASTATLCAIISAREKSTNHKANFEGVPQVLRVYCSSQTHSSIDKAVAIAGIGRNNLVKIKVDEKMSMDPKDLERCIILDLKSGYIPCCVVSAMGTTGTVAIDPIHDISRICMKYNIWHHVDAAYAGTAMILPEYQHLMKGVEDADSFVFNPHKWMFTHFDCSVYFVKDASALINAFEITPEYLKTETRGQVNDYRDWGVQLGRRFRALKLWFVIRTHGVEGIQSKLRKHIELSTYFTSFINQHIGLEHLTDPILNFNIFHVRESDDIEECNRKTADLLDKINSTGKVFLSHTKVNGRYGIRVVIGQTYVEKAHIDLLINTIKTCLKGLS